MVNEEIVGVAKPGKVFFVDLKPGHYKVQTNGSDEDVDLKLGDTRYVRFDAGVAGIVGEIHPELVSDSVGSSEVQNMAFDPDMKHLLRYPACTRF